MSSVSTQISKYMGAAVQLADIWGSVIINAKAAPFYAKGNGIADDTVSLQAAVDYAISVGKKEINLPVGTYRYTVLTNTEDIVFIGDGVTLSGTTGLNLTSTAALQVETATNILRFGAKVDGVTDDTAAIQTAVKYCYENSVNLYGVPGSSVISGTIYLPSNAVEGRRITLDFKGMNFDVADGITLFESGIYSGGTWSSTFDEPIDTHMSFNVLLKGFKITGGTKGIRIANWHQMCSVEDVRSRDCSTVVEAKNCYYSNFENIFSVVNAVPPYTGTRFIFSEQCNLMRFSRLVATNSNIGYLFSGSVTASQLTNISFEGMAIGIQFESQVFDCVIENSYMENVSDTVIKCESNVDNLTIRNNYINFVAQPNMHLLDYVPLPLNNIVIEQDNVFIAMTDDSKLYKTKDNRAGYNSVTFKRPPRYTTDPSDLLLNPSHFSTELIIKQEVNLPRARGKVVNGYAPGIYSGRYSGGYTGGVAGCNWVNNANAICTMDTKIVFSDTQRIYVNLRISTSSFTFIRGEFIGSIFYEFTDTTVTVSTALTISTVGGFQRIVSGSLSGGNVSAVDGEIRLM